MAKKKQIKVTALKNRDRVGVIMTLLYVLFLFLSVAILVKIVAIQLTYKVPASVEHYFRPSNTKRVEEPQRGSILSEDGKLLALSTPLYQIYMDCTVQKEAYRKDKDKEDRWRSDARNLGNGLAAIFNDKTGKEYSDMILTGRDEGKKYMKIGFPIDHRTLQDARKLPLFCDGPNRGGMIVTKIDTRQYPYGSLARRVIGYVKDNSRSEGNSRIGIEGKFDYELHGKEGYEWLRVTDDNLKVHNYDSAYVKAEDGMDVRTTLNIDIQDIVDRAVRTQIQDNAQIMGACAILMEVSTGAIRAMVNLQRDEAEGSPLQERLNLAIGQVGEQGSVFKTVTLMSLVEDGYVKSLEQTIPTNHGFVPGGYNQDVHILDYERLTGRNEITVKHGFEISSNYVFTYLATRSYGSHPKDFFDKIYNYKLGERFDFDLVGLGTPQVTTPDSPGWSATTLGTAAYGYSIAVTPLHVATFYNAIANKGKMMKPYLVEDIEKDGVVKKKYGPGILSNICSKATADTLTRALMAVTEEGTAKRLKNARLQVAGKTGTAQVALSPADKPRKGDAYHDEAGRKKNQGTFVGFFPADNPKYTILVSVYSFLSHTSFYGGTIPAAAVREIVDNISSIQEDWSEEIRPTAQFAVPAAPNIIAEPGMVPDLRGMGLRDAVHELESRGYKCTFNGTGHVVSQSPAALSKAPAGQTVKIELK